LRKNELRFLILEREKIINRIENLKLELKLLEKLVKRRDEIESELKSLNNELNSINYKIYSLRASKK